MRRSFSCLGMLLVTVAAGIGVRFVPLHLPWFVWKYLGSALWAVALYWFVAMLVPQARSMVLWVIASVAALLVEVSRLMPERHVDAFRLTLAGKLILGRYFSGLNIVAYLVAITFTAWFDWRFRSGRILT
jgi:hypothetical protein